MLVTLAVAACGGRGPLPPHPDHTTTPNVVGVLAGYDSAGCVSRFHLDSGQQIELGFGDCGHGKPPRPILGWSNWSKPDRPGEPIVHGDLMLFGEDETGPWYVSASDRSRDGSCYQTWGGAYREGDFAHFSAGLRLPIAANFTWNPVQGTESNPFPLREGDYVCLDRSGTLISAYLPVDR